MDWNELLRPTKFKVIISAIITIIWAAFVLVISEKVPCLAVICSADEPRGLVNFSLFHHCSCEYVSLFNLITEYTILFIVPFVISYIAVSIITKK
jgi:hypothetical protein